MITKIIVSENKEEHESKMNDFFNTIKQPRKVMFFHKIIKANKGGLSFLTYIHYSYED
jgi:hypothetical protein